MLSLFGAYVLSGEKPRANVVEAPSGLEGAILYSVVLGTATRTNSPCSGDTKTAICAWWAVLMSRIVANSEQQGPSSLRECGRISG